jgi:hypothetical protein
MMEQISWITDRNSTAMHARVSPTAWLNIVLKASVRSASCLIGQGGPGREDARHDDETTDPLKSIAPAADGRVILA